MPAHSHSAILQAMAEEPQDHFQETILPAERKPVTIREIARHCGVGKSTVALALQGKGAPATRERILTAASTLGYQPALQESARRLSLRKTGQQTLNHLISVFTSLDITPAEYARAIFRGIARVCNEARFGLMLNHLGIESPSPDFSLELPRVYEFGGVDGVILLEGQSFLVQHLRQLPGFGMRPIISLLQPSSGGSSVTADDYAGARAIAEHLFDLGHRHLLYLYAPLESPLVQTRVAGLNDACHARGLTPAAHLTAFEIETRLMDPARVSHTLPPALPDTLEMPPRAHALLQHLRAHPEITALLAENDAMALNLWRFCIAAGYRIPDDLSLVGFDDTDPMLDAAGQPLLTSVRVPLEEIGATAAEQLLRLVHGRATDPVHTVLPTQLIVRHSTAPARRGV